MKCTKCGAEIAEGSVFCGECGSKTESVETTVEKSVSLGTEEASVEANYSKTPEAFTANATVNVNLAWAKFLGYFALWAGALFNFISAVRSFTGSDFGYEKNSIYEMYPLVQPVMILTAILTLALSAACAYSAICIIKQKKAVIKFLPLTNFLCAFVTAFNIIGLSVAVSFNCSNASAIATILVNVAMGFVNMKYFSNRSEIYCN